MWQFIVKSPRNGTAAAGADFTPWTQPDIPHISSMSRNRILTSDPPLIQNNTRAPELIAVKCGERWFAQDQVDNKLLLGKPARHPQNEDHKEPMKTTLTWLENFCSQTGSKDQRTTLEQLGVQFVFHLLTCWLRRSRFKSTPPATRITYYNSPSKCNNGNL